MANSGLLSIGRSALITHQAVMQTISQNIANAETPGYSRQEALLEVNTPVRMPYGNVGTGVHVESIIRKRDVLMDESARAANAKLGNANRRHEELGDLEAVFGEPSDAGMASALDQFYGAWSDLATSPSSSSARVVVQQRGKQLAGLLNEYDASLSTQRVNTMDRLSALVTEINGLAAQVAEINGRLVGAESGSMPANDLRDQRDTILDKLATLAGARSYSHENGGVTVVVGNSTIVDGSTARPLDLSLVMPNPMPAVVPSDIAVKIRMGASPDALHPLEGELGAMVTFINDSIPGVRSRLDAMASSLVTAVNTAHTGGFTFSGTAIPGTAAGNFFDAGTVTNPVRAGTIALDAIIAADATKIASSADANAPTDNTTALAMAALRTASSTVSYTTPSGTTETGSLLGFFRTTVTSLGLDTQRAADDVDIYTSLAENADARRQSVSGVNTDEELVNLMRTQQAYQAATKLIKAADEMLQTLISLI